MKRGARIRPENNTDLVEAIRRTGGRSEAIESALSLANCPRNIRFLNSAIKNLLDLSVDYAKHFEILNSEKRALLDNCYWAHEKLQEFRKSDLGKDIFASPKEDGIGIFGYAVTTAPIFGILLLDHPHESTRQFFRSIVAKVVSHYLYLRVNFSFDVHNTMLAGKDISRSPIPLHSRICDIEKALRDISADTNNDHLSVIANSTDAAKFSAIITQLKSSRYNNAYSSHSYDLARSIDSFLEEESGESSRINSRRSKRRIRNGLSYGTLIAGDFTISEIEETSCCIIDSYSNDSIRHAAVADCHPSELEDDHPVIVIDDEDAATLPISAKRRTSERHSQQIARSQQMSPLRKGGIKSHYVFAFQETCSRVSELNPLYGLLLQAVVATGRPLRDLESFDLTQGAELADAKAAIELDIVKRVWRIKVNQPDLVNTDPIPGAIPVVTHAEVPDLLGSSDVALNYLMNLPKRERHKVKCTAQIRNNVAGIIRTELGKLGITEAYLARMVGMALYEATGDLAVGSLITKWLPLDAPVYLHYLTVNIPTIGRHYQAALDRLSRYGLTLIDHDWDAPAAYVGMTNCPSDRFIHTLVETLTAKLDNHPIRTRNEVNAYINLYTAYTVLLVAAGLGFRSRVDPKPNLNLVKTPFYPKGFACFADKQSTEGHFRVQIVPDIVLEHLKQYDLFRESVSNLLGGDVLTKAGNPLFTYITENGNARPFSPSDLNSLMRDDFNFSMNCFRRRMRSKMVAYDGANAAELGRNYAIWMGHWTYWTNPFRVEAGFNTRSMVDLKLSIVEPILASDGWRSLEPRI